MDKEVSGSLLLGFGVLSSVISKTGSTEYYLPLYDKALILVLIVSGAALLVLKLAEEYK